MRPSADACVMRYGGIILLLMVGITRSSSSDELMRIKRGSRDRWCMDDRRRCRKDESCQYAYQYVKDNCWTKEDNHCRATQDKLSTCLHYIEVLRSTAFQSEASQCTCSMTSSLKKFKKCSTIYNIVFANPCYEQAAAAREEAVKIASKTVRNQVVKETDYVTKSSYASESVLKDAGVVMRNHVIDASQSATTTTEAIPKQAVVEGVKSHPPPSEDDFNEVDNMFAKVNEAKPKKETSLRDVINFEGETKDLRKADVATVMTTQTEGISTTTSTQPPVDGVLEQVVQEDESADLIDYSLVITLTVVGGLLLILFSVVGGFVLHNRRTQQTYKAGMAAKKSSFIVRSIHDNKYNCKKSKIHL